MDDEPESQSLFPLISFEFLFGIFGILLAWGIGLWPDSRLESIGQPYQSETISDAAQHALWGVIWTVPLVLLITLIRRLPLQAIRDLETWSDQHLLPLIRGRSLLALAAIAISAGLGEELFFRWALQTGFTQYLSGPLGIGLGLAVTSIIFGLLHAITPAYGILAGLLGLVLGIELLVTESLVAVIVTHALYDFVVLLQAVIEDQQAQASNQETSPTDS